MTNIFAADAQNFSVPETSDIASHGESIAATCTLTQTCFPLQGGVTLRAGPLNYLFVHSTEPGAYCLGVFDNHQQGTLLGGITFRNVYVQVCSCPTLAHIAMLSGPLPQAFLKLVQAPDGCLLTCQGRPASSISALPLLNIYR